MTSGLQSLGDEVDTFLLLTEVQGSVTAVLLPFGTLTKYYANVMDPDSGLQSI